MPWIVGRRRADSKKELWKLQQVSVVLALKEQGVVSPKKLERTLQVEEDSGPRSWALGSMVWENRPTEEARGVSEGQAGGVGGRVSMKVGWGEPSVNTVRTQGRAPGMGGTGWPRLMV